MGDSYISDKLKNILNFLSNIFDIMLLMMYYDLARDGKEPSGRR